MILIRAICLGGLLLFLSPALLRAQEEHHPWSYITADPIDADRLGLATESGRYAIRVDPDCQLALAPGMEVMAAISNIDGEVVVGDGYVMCRVSDMVLMDTTPCFTNSYGICDVNLEGF